MEIFYPVFIDFQPQKSMWLHFNVASTQKLVKGKNAERKYRNVECKVEPCSRVPGLYVCYSTIPLPSFLANSYYTFRR